MSFLDRFRRRAPAPAPPQRSLAAMLDGYRVTCAMVAAVEIGLVERLERGPAIVADLAAELGVNEDALRRFLRALEALRVVAPDGESFRLTPLGRRLARSRDVAALIGAEYLAAWSGLARSVRTAEPAFLAAFGMSAWEHRRAHPALGRAFDAFMARIQERTVAGILESFDFSRAGLVVDVGGGRGGVLAGILHAHAGVRGILFDLPEVAEAVTSFLVAAGVADRARTVGGSFFDEVPPGGDVYVLEHVLHDWDDERCRAILANCRRAMAPGGTLLIVESLLPEGGGATQDQALRDLHMMVVLGGRERTRREYEDLLRAAGLVPARVTTSLGGTDVIEARRAATNP